jgi:hypothetical protein
LPSLSGYYQLDENLNINFTAKAKTVKFDVVTLPLGGPDRDSPNRARAPFTSAVTILEDQQRRFSKSDSSCKTSELLLNSYRAVSWSMSQPEYSQPRCF